MHLEIYDGDTFFSINWPQDELVIICMSYTHYYHFLGTIPSLYHRRKTAWRCPCIGYRTLDNKRDLANALHACNLTQEALMLPSKIVSSVTDITKYPVILKPFNDGCGRGIMLADGPGCLDEKFRPKICTQLVRDCLLYNGTHKADLRMFAIIHPHTKRALLYRDALVRCSQTVYTEGSFEAEITNTSVHQHDENTTAPPLLSHLHEYVQDKNHRSRIYSDVVNAVSVVGKAVFTGLKKVRERDFVFVGLDVLVRSDPTMPPIVLEYNVSWDRSKEDTVSSIIKRNAVQELVQSMLCPDRVHNDVCTTTWK